MSRQVKQCIDQYRIIQGIYFEMWTACECDFKEEIAKAKSNGQRYRIIDRQLYLERLIYLEKQD